MSTLLQTVILGVFQGALDALLALGIVLIYRTTGVLNFSQAATGTLSAYVMYWMCQGRPIATLWIALPTGLLAGGATNLAAYELVRKVRSKHYALSAAVASLAVAALVRQIIQQVTNVGGFQAVGQFPDPFAAGFLNVGDVTIAYFYIAAVSCAGLLAVAIGAFLRWNRLGIMIRAIADNEESALLCGARSVFLVGAVWFVAGLLAGLAGFFDALLSFNPSFLDPLFVASLIAAVLGGLRSLTGAFLGGILLEVGANLFQTYGPSDFQQFSLTFLLLLLLAVLILAPRTWLAPSSRRTV